jgi:negative regulator of flagellin synthesis FlgM
MNVNNNLQGLQQLLSSQEVVKGESAQRGGTGAGQVQGGVDEATLSSAASVAAQTAPDADVRMEKVAAVQQALAGGTYSVPSTEVAGKMIDAMLSR